MLAVNGVSGFTHFALITIVNGKQNIEGKQWWLSSAFSTHYVFLFKLIFGCVQKHYAMVFLVYEITHETIMLSSVKLLKIEIN